MPRDFQRPFTRPTGATEVVFVRHGSSRSAIDAAPVDGAPVDAAQAHADPPLSERGRRQAVAVAERLARERFERLFVTPMRRTAETAAPLAARLGVVPTVVEDLREVYLGDWEHDFRARVASGDPLTTRVFAAQRWDVIPNAEDMESFSERVRRGIDHIADVTGPDAAALAVVHGGVVAEVCRHATGSQAFAFLYAENGSISRLIRLASGRWALRSFNDIAHLEALAPAPEAAPGAKPVADAELG